MQKEMNWEVKENMLQKSFEFRSFVEALNFVNRVGEVAERLDHHPDIKIHDYKKVTIQSTTHEARSVTEKDYVLAEKIDSLNLA